MTPDTAPPLAPESPTTLDGLRSTLRRAAGALDPLTLAGGESAARRADLLAAAPPADPTAAGALAAAAARDYLASSRLEVIRLAAALARDVAAAAAVLTAEHRGRSPTWAGISPSRAPRTSRRSRT